MAIIISHTSIKQTRKTKFKQIARVHNPIFNYFHIPNRFPNLINLTMLQLRKTHPSQSLAKDCLPKFNLNLCYLWSLNCMKKLKTLTKRTMKNQLLQIQQFKTSQILNQTHLQDFFVPQFYLNDIFRTLNLFRIL